MRAISTGLKHFMLGVLALSSLIGIEAFAGSDYVPPAACSAGTRILIQVYRQEEMDLLKPIQAALREGRFLVPAMENLEHTYWLRQKYYPGKYSQITAYPHPMILFHDPATQACAETLKTYLDAWRAQDAARLGKRIQVASIPIGQTSRPGTIEIWWPPVYPACGNPLAIRCQPDIDVPEHSLGDWLKERLFKSAK